VSCPWFAPEETLLDIESQTSGVPADSLMSFGLGESVFCKPRLSVYKNSILTSKGRYGILQHAATEILHFLVGNSQSRWRGVGHASTLSDLRPKDNEFEASKVNWMFRVQFSAGKSGTSLELFPIFDGQSG